jgi:hypothetical protein
MQDGEAGPCCAEHWEGCVTHYPYNPDTVLDVPDYDAALDNIGNELGCLRIGIMMGDITIVVTACSNIDEYLTECGHPPSLDDPTPEQMLQADTVVNKLKARIAELEDKLDEVK